MNSTRLQAVVCLCLLFLLSITSLACETRPDPQLLPITPTTAPNSIALGIALGAESVASVLDPTASDNLFPAVRPTSANHTTLFNDLNNGLLDAILVHHIPPDYREFWFNPVALDGLLIIVHPDNPITGLSLGEVQTIFSGRQTLWPNGESITVLVRERDAGARALFEQRIMAERRVAIVAETRPTPQAIVSAVSQDRNAIGFVMLGSSLTGVRPLVIDGVTASPATVADQSYPLTVPLYWVGRAEPQANARVLLSWLQSEAGQAKIGVQIGRIR